MDKKGKQIAKQGAILAAASLLVRIIGALYRIPMTNILGDEGNAYYGAAFNIYMYLLIISSYAMPTAISRLVSSLEALKHRKEAHQLFKASVVLNILISSFFTLALWYIAKPYAKYISLPGAEAAIKNLAPSLLIFAIMSSFRGYFQGMHTMVPTAFSQVIEQVFNASFSIILSYWLMQKGPEYGAAGGTMGTGIGALSGLVFLLFIYGIYRSHLPKSITSHNHLHIGKMVVYWKTILLTSVPMVIGIATFNISTLIDDAMFNRALFFHNYSYDEISILYGILVKYNLILTMPIAIAAAIATTGVPSISSSVALGDRAGLEDKVKSLLKAVVLIAMPASIGIFVMAGPVLNLMFTMGASEKITTDIIQIGAITILLFSLSTLSVGILQGLGYVKIPVSSAVKSILIKVAFNFIVFYAFNFNLYGAAVANIVFSLASAYFNLSAVLAKTKIRLNYIEIFLRPMGASSLMGLVAFMTYLILNIFMPSSKLGNGISTLISIMVAMISYFMLSLKLRVVSLEELGQMPMGPRLVGLARKIIKI